MNLEKLKAYQKQYQEELFDRVLPFWEKPYDPVNGGYYSYVALDGTLYNSDKSVWIQGRSLWLFSYLCNQYGKQEKWLEIAASCKKFLDDHCFDTDGRMFYTVTADGRPLRKRRYFFSETFYIIGCAEYAIATGDPQVLEDARRVYKMVSEIYDDRSKDPFKMPPKYYKESRPTMGLGEPMIMLNVTSIMRRCDPDNAAYYDERSRVLLDIIMEKFYHEDMETFFETVAADGSFMDNSMGRTINPGHAIEASWFMIREAQYFKDEEIIRKAKKIFEWSLKYGWDKEYGGIYYFVDIKGFPCEQYEQDMKLWWPINEATIAALAFYELTGEKYYEEWFDTFTEYGFTHFSDKVHGGWVGYLTRKGEWQQPPTKGNGFKSGFHNIRMLVECDKMLGNLIAKQQ